MNSDKTIACTTCCREAPEHEYKKLSMTGHYLCSACLAEEHNCGCGDE